MRTNDDSDLHGACPIPMSSMMAEKTDRSSALSICTGLVPRMFTPRLYRGSARLFGICPPTDIIAPPQPYINIFSLVKYNTILMARIPMQIGINREIATAC